VQGVIRTVPGIQILDFNFNTHVSLPLSDTCPSFPYYKRTVLRLRETSRDLLASTRHPGFPF